MQCNYHSPTSCILYENKHEELQWIFKTFPIQFTNLLFRSSYFLFSFSFTHCLVSSSSSFICWFAIIISVVLGRGFDVWVLFRLINWFPVPPTSNVGKNFGIRKNKTRTTTTLHYKIYIYIWNFCSIDSQCVLFYSNNSAFASKNICISCICFLLLNTFFCCFFLFFLLLFLLTHKNTKTTHTKKLYSNNTKSTHTLFYII